MKLQYSEYIQQIQTQETIKTQHSVQYINTVMNVQYIYQRSDIQKSQPTGISTCKIKLHHPVLIINNIKFTYNHCFIVTFMITIIVDI